MRYVNQNDIGYIYLYLLLDTSMPIMDEEEEGEGDLTTSEFNTRVCEYGIESTVLKIERFIPQQDEENNDEENNDEDENKGCGNDGIIGEGGKYGITILRFVAISSSLYHTNNM